MSTATRYIQASIEHLKYAQNGGALRARFSNGFHGKWVEGWLVGWVQGNYPWICCHDDPSNFDAEWSDEPIEDLTYQYCEILESDLGVKHGS